MTAIAYLQPATRGEISRLVGREISRDVIGALKRHGLIDGALRAPEPGAPFAYVTTGKFLEVFGLASLRDLPDVERLEEEGLLQKPRGDIDLDGALGLGDGDPLFEEDFEFDDPANDEGVLVELSFECASAGASYDATKLLATQSSRAWQVVTATRGAAKRQVTVNGESPPVAIPDAR